MSSAHWQPYPLADIQENDYLSCKSVLLLCSILVSQFITVALLTFVGYDYGELRLQFRQWYTNFYIASPYFLG